jgi:hypothetical protein
VRRWNAFATWEPERRVALTPLGFQKNRFDVSILQCVVRRVSRDWIQPEEAQPDEVQSVEAGNPAPNPNQEWRYNNAIHDARQAR